MEELEKEFEEMLINTKNVELINKYAELKIQINLVFEKVLKSMD
jgi:hypothetical protein